MVATLSVRRAESFEFIQRFFYLCLTSIFFALKVCIVVIYIFVPSNWH